MIRTEALWISAFLAVGAIGGLVYNWPDEQSDPNQDEVRSNTDTLSDSLLPNASNDVNGEEEAVLRENPQLASEDAKLLPLEQREEQGIWSEIAPPSKRSQPIDLNVLELGDKYLTGGNSVGAYQHYLKLWQQADLPTDDAVLIRLGLAAETASLFDQAEEHYRSAIRVSKKGSVQQLVSLLGTARVWEQTGQLDDAIILLGELLLLYAHDGYPDLIRQSVVKQLADCLQKRLLGTEVVTRALAEEPMEYHQCPLAIYPILEMADWEPPEPPPENPGTGLKLLQNPRGDASLILVEAHLDGVSIIKLIADLQTLTGIQFEVTEKAKSELVGRLTNASSPAVSVSLLLDQVLESLQLTWSQVDQVIKIMHRKELTARDTASYDLARAQRMLQQVQLNFPNGPERTAAIMSDGNNARLSGEWEVATEKYRSAREARPMHELSAKLHFNEASLGLMQGDNLNSLHSCYMALDQTLSPALQGQVYGTIADLELEFGQPAKAITAASRGLRRADNPAVFTRAAMTLARAYLLSDDPFSANSVLFDSSDRLVGERTRRLATVLGTYARFLHVRPKVGLQDEGQRLVLALAALKPSDVDSFADGLLVSDAFSAVGLRAQAIDSLSVALDLSPPGYWNERIRYQLAEMHYEASEFGKANEVVESFGTVSSDLLPKVLLLHGSVQLELGNVETSKSILRRLLSLDVAAELKAKGLEKLGRALEQTGDHYAAALCFAGLLPKEEGGSGSGATATTEESAEQQ